MKKTYRERYLLIKTKLDRKALGNRIRDARNALGMTQPRLAASLGVSLTTIERHEAGARAPSLALVFELSRLTGTSLDDLCGLPVRRRDPPDISIRRQGAEHVAAQRFAGEKSRHNRRFGLSAGVHDG